MHLYDPATGRAEYSVADVMRKTERPRRSTTRAFERWQARGWPRVRRAPCQGDPRGEWRVDAAEYDAMRAGQITEAPVASPPLAA